MNKNNALILKKVFTCNDCLDKEVSKDLLSVYLRKEVISVEKMSYDVYLNVNQYEETRDAFRVTFSDGKEGNVEIHIGNEKNDIPRMMYYLAQLHKSRIKYVKSYSQFCSSYAILISNTQLIDNEKQYHDFCLQDEDKIMFSDLLHVILIELSKVKEKRIDDMSAIEGWNYFFRNYENEEKQSIIELIKKKWSGVVMAEKKITQISQEQIDRINQIYDDRFQLEEQWRFEDAMEEKYESGKKEGIEESYKTIVTKLSK